MRLKWQPGGDQIVEIDTLYKKMLGIIQGPVDFAAYINSDLEIHELMFKHLSNTLLRESWIE